jgi:hypothetical protein
MILNDLKLEPMPCKDCIALAACKGRVLSTSDNEKQLLCLINIAYDGCSILLEYVSDGRKRMHTPNEYMKYQYLLKFFNGLELEPPDCPTDYQLTNYFKDISMALLDIQFEYVKKDKE